MLNATPGSLRQIRFSFSTSGPYTITLASALSALTDTSGVDISALGLPNAQCNQPQVRLKPQPLTTADYDGLLLTGG
jgi:hypothetical protein